MNKIIPLITCLVILFLSCKNDLKNDIVMNQRETVSTQFNQLLDEYYEDGLKLNPLTATFAGDARYNNEFPNTLSDEYKSEIKAYYTNYLEKITHFKEQDLSESEKMSKAILKWDCTINLNGLAFRQDLFPIDQMWSVNLMMGQLASGAAAQPFNTVEDYNNWLQRLEGYLEWLASAESKMTEGIKLGYVLPKSLITKAK